MTLPLVTVGDAAAARAPALDATVPGGLLFARFAIPPNQLGLCGPATGDQLHQRVREGREDGELRRIARGFEGAWPYLELLAGDNGIADPLDARVVEAYWLGNGLSGGVRERTRFDDLDRRFRRRSTPDDWRWLGATAERASRVHHSFHVLEVLPRVGMIRGGVPDDLLGVVERCLVRPGCVVAVSPDALLVDLPVLRMVDGRLQLAPSTVPARIPLDGAGFGDRYAADDLVAIHWDRVCGRLDPITAGRLAAITAANLSETVALR